MFPVSSREWQNRQYTSLVGLVAALTAVLLVFVIPTSPTSAQTATAPTAEQLQQAADYSEQYRGDAVLVYVDGALIYEEYQNGYDSTELHLLASGSKSFSCVIAAAAIEDGLLTGWDENVAETITEFAEDEQKAQITLRNLLNLTSGLQHGGRMLRAGRDTYAAAIAQPLTDAPGERFAYGNTHYQVFAAFIQRKLVAASMDSDPAAYLWTRVLEPIGVEQIEWTRDRIGNPNLAGGASMTARDWAKFGQLILNNGMWEGAQILPADTLQACFQGAMTNPNYGLTFWLSYNVADSGSLEAMVQNPPDPADSVPTEPARIYIAAGAGKQRLYIIPELNMVVVRFGRQDRRFDDAEFLSLLLGDLLTQR
jgi:CubicO group peptidase (beta-lactamase class C family)